eukprot:6303615-Amphidinium_carterae.1
MSCFTVRWQQVKFMWMLPMTVTLQPSTLMMPVLSIATTFALKSSRRRRKRWLLPLEAYKS